jgi:hypothetical protein
MSPSNGYRIGIGEIRTQRNINFTWSAVQGANGYIFTLFQESSFGGKREIIRRPPENRTSWTLDDIGELDRGTFYWQVEAVNSGQGGTIEQRGRPGENSFVIDIPRPGPPLQIHEELIEEELGIFYGN